MADLIERFRSLDQIDSPDLWGDATNRSPRNPVPSQRPGQRVVTILVAFAVAAAAIAFAVRALGGGTSARPAGQPSPVTIEPHANGAIYYTASAGESGSSVHSMRPDGSGDQVVFGRNDYVEQLAWSSDGTRIAYRGSWSKISQSGSSSFSIFTASADGANASRVTSGPYDGWPSWSPDGSKIAFSSVASSGFDPRLCGPGGDPLCPTDIYVMNSDGSGRVQLTQDPAPEFDPEWSPDGTKIAFVRVVGDSAEIEVMNADGSGLITVATGTGGNDRRFSWSPDGTQLAYVSTSDNAWGINVVNTDGTGDHTILERDGVYSEGPVWSPDGSKIAFQSTLGAYPPGCGQSSDVCSDLFTMNPDGSHLDQMTNGPTGIYGIAWQPLPATSPTPVAKQQVTTVDVGKPSSLSSIAYGEGSAWVAVREGPSFDRPFIVRLDASTGEEIAKIPVDTVPEWEVGGGGLVVANGSVWVGGRTFDRQTQGESGEIIQIDPQTNTVVQTIPLAGDPVADIAVDDQGIWALANSGDYPILLRIDPSSNQVVASIPLEGGTGRSVVSVNGTIYATVRTGTPDLTETLYQLDTANHWTARFENQPLGALSASDGFGWWADGGGLIRLDPASGPKTMSSAFNTGDAIAAGYGAVWYLNGGRALTRYDIATDAVTESAASGGHTPIALAATPDGVWAANEDGTVTRV